jgi:hypothetical protein
MVILRLSRRGPVSSSHPEMEGLSHRTAK